MGNNTKKIDVLNTERLLVYVPNFEKNYIERIKKIRDIIDFTMQGGKK